jgi:hypothetical protein
MLDIESAAILMELFLPAASFVHTQPFVDWMLHQQTSYRALNSDQYLNFYDFSQAGMLADLSNYDGEEGCWACIIDEYVEFAVNATSVADGC